MSSFNRVIIAGRLLKDVSYRESAGGKGYCFFSLLIPARGKKDDENIIVDVTCFGKTAQNLQNDTQKGFKLLIEGRLHVDRFKDDVGNPRAKLKVVGERVQYLSPKPKPIDFGECEEAEYC